MIFTFYSYKGGAGRSMALANVAQWFYQQGLRVVIIDWNMEELRDWKISSFPFR